MKKLKELYPTSKHIPVRPLSAFDPLQECIALPAKRMKKATRFKTVLAEVVVLPICYPLVLPKGKRRQELMKSGHIKNVQMKRNWSSLEVKRSIDVTFKGIGLRSWNFLEMSGGKLVLMADQCPGGEILQRRGSLYIQELVSS